MKLGLDQIDGGLTVTGADSGISDAGSALMHAAALPEERDSLCALKSPLTSLVVSTTIHLPPCPAIA
ncbi:hypothetical protein GCM10010844_42990 [Deinococcus radiotolerans]|uniref:Uncharacterized protein n=1 Tax=Deinococcus radiotolerans TaxID=1309407 RepID=A0ABQ2FRP3_9DEIO|nr:hypothetical protein GCM10010844_42990 [Deinococcus radiotolerans]